MRGSRRSRDRVGGQDNVKVANVACPPGAGVARGIDRTARHASSCGPRSPQLSRAGSGRPKHLHLGGWWYVDHQPPNHWSWGRARPGRTGAASSATSRNGSAPISIPMVATVATNTAGPARGPGRDGATWRAARRAPPARSPADGIQRDHRGGDDLPTARRRGGQSAGENSGSEPEDNGRLSAVTFSRRVG